MTTGSIPTFIDISSNFASPEIDEDNIIFLLTLIHSKCKWGINLAQALQSLQKIKNVTKSFNIRFSI